MSQSNSLPSALFLYRVIGAIVVGVSVLFVAAMAFTTLKQEPSPMMCVGVAGLALSGSLIGYAFPKIGSNFAYESTKRRRARTGSRDISDILDDIHADIDDKYI